MSIVNRYVFKECLINTLLCLAVFVSILLTGRVLKLANLIINKGVDLYHVVLVFVNIIPTFLELAIPLSILLGVMMSINRLSLDSELVVLKSSGLSIKKLLPPVLVLGLIGTLICYFITFYLRPAAHDKLQNTLFEIAKSRATSGLSAGTFNKLGKLILYSEQITNGNSLKRVVIDDQRDDKNRKITFSNSGVITSNPKQSSIQILLSDGATHERNPQSYALTNFDNNNISISTDEIFGVEEASNKRAQELEYSELKESLTTATEKKKKTGYVAEIYRRYSSPLACLILAILALPLGVSAPRNQKSWGASLAVSVGLLVYVFYYGLSSVGMSLSSSLPPVIAGWLTNAIFAFLAYYLLKKISNETWSSVVDEISSKFKRFKKA